MTRTASARITTLSPHLTLVMVDGYSGSVGGDAMSSHLTLVMVDGYSRSVGGDAMSPHLTLVMVDGYSRSVGPWVVTPISIEPAHLVTTLSSRTSNSSWGRRCRDVITTPLLKSSIALGREGSGQ